MAVRILPKRLSQLLVLLILVAVVAGTAVFLLLPAPTKSLTARFDRAVGLYPGSSVRLHGVAIGTISKVKPDGNGVLVSMKYRRSIDLPAYPAGAKVVRAAIIPPSLVSDRYVQLLDMSACGAHCPVLADHAAIGQSQTASPVELDDIYAALNTLNTALGPKGADSQSLSKNGPLSDLIDVGAANLNGNGVALGTTIENLSHAVTTLADSRADLFGTVKNLQVFSDALVANDAQIRRFNTQLDEVTSALADERGSLAAALRNLSTALADIAGFLKKNGSAIHTDVVGLKDVTSVLNRQKAALNEILAVAPTAVSNLGHTYNPVSGTLDTRANLGGLNNPLDPAVICSALTSLGKLPVAGTLKQTCDQIAKVIGGLPILGGGGDGTPSGGGPLPIPKLGGP